MGALEDCVPAFGGGTQEQWEGEEQQQLVTSALKAPCVPGTAQVPQRPMTAATATASPLHEGSS